LSDRSRELIGRLRLARHPEGGWYRQVYRSRSTVATAGGERSAITTIYYLLEGDEISRWHVVDADEIWHFYCGAALELVTYDPQATRLTRCELGSPESGLEAVGVVPAGVWQAARSLGDYSLAGCSVAPGFEFPGFKFVASMPDHERHFERELASLSGLL
jgi:predicted cupin superfamily sugar epimerase